MTRRHVVEFEQDASFLKQNFSIRLEQPTLSDDLSNIADINGYTEQDWLFEIKRQKPFYFRVKTTFTGSISWQFLYATHLLVDCELKLKTRSAPLYSSPYSWIPITEAAITAVWLIKSYWNPASTLFKPVVRHSAYILTQVDYLFATITMMFGSRHDQPQDQSSKSSTQTAPQTTSHRIHSFTSTLNTDYGDGNKDPLRHLHSMGLNCYIFPCFGVCLLRQSSDSRGYAERSLNDGESSLNYTGETAERNALHHLANRYRLSYMSQLDPLLQAHGMGGNPANNCNPAGGVASNSMSSEPVDTTDAVGQLTCDVAVVKKDGQLQPCGTICKNSRSLSSHKSSIHSGQRTCEVTVVGKNGQLRPCGKVCKNKRALWDHKGNLHTGQKTCAMIVVGEDNQPRPCGKVCNSARNLSYHKRDSHCEKKICDLTVVGKNGQLRPCGKICKNNQYLQIHKKCIHSGQQTCDEVVVSKDGKPQPCGKVCRNAKTLLVHKRSTHSGQQTCDATVIGEDGQPQPCGKLCKSIQALSDHKNRNHCKQATCNVTVIGENNQKQPCGKVCKNTRVLSSHKSRVHTGQKTCGESLFGEGGLPKPCGIVFLNAQALSTHKRKEHSGQQICDKTVIGKDGLPQPCEKICKNAHALSSHKRIHRKRKPVDINRDDDFTPQEDRAICSDFLTGDALGF
ncbi:MULTISPECIES: hypothetical protein [unclassified Endozoicomonas]|uniref:hypothetical protein n=1 Tax=unclassified Endozoicomonas TaxID=2644528 RepID=UPI003BB494B3